jgi:hypothetical protein
MTLVFLGERGFRTERRSFGFSIDIEPSVLILRRSIISWLSGVEMGYSGSSIPRLQAFFNWLVRRTFRDLGIRDTDISEYISLLLASFARTENLYRIHDVRGRRLETTVEMLLEANVSWYSEQWDREKEIRKHIGDYILFMAGVFREWVEMQSCMDFYLEEGKKAYQSVSQYHKRILRGCVKLYEEDLFQGPRGR